MLKSFIVLDVELGSYVTDWGNIEEIKDVLLAKTTLFTGELNITVQNSLGQFSPENPGSLIYGRNIYNISCSVSFDCASVFQVYLKDVQFDRPSRTAVFVIQNVFTLPADSVLPNLTLTGVSPADAMLEAINSVGLLGLTDVRSFLSAGVGATAAGASVNVVTSAQNQISLLDFLQQMAELSSISVFVDGGLIRARLYQGYQGSGSNLKQSIDATFVRDFGQRSTAYDAFNNKITVKYGANSSFSANDVVSQGLTKVTREFVFSTNTGGLIGVPDLVSAQYFAQLALSRSSKPPTTISLTADKEFLTGITLGDRFPVSEPNWFGSIPRAFELIETHRDPSDLSIAMTLRGVD